MRKANSNSKINVGCTMNKITYLHTEFTLIEVQAHNQHGLCGVPYR